MKIGSLKITLLFSFALISAVSASAFERPSETFNPAKRVSRTSRVTYLSLMKKAFPGANTDGYGDLNSISMADIKQLDTGKIKRAYGGQLTLQFAGGFSGATRRVLLFWLRPDQETEGKSDDIAADGSRILHYSTMVLMLFKTVGEPALLDIVEAPPRDNQTDIVRSNLAGYFWLVSHHENCEKSIKNYILISERGDQLVQAYNELPTLYDDGDCGRMIRQEPYLVFRSGTMYLNVVSDVTGYTEPCTGRMREKYTKFFQFKLRPEADGRLTTITSQKTALRRELVKWGLEYEEETGSK